MQIFLDVDDVLVDFVGGALKIHNKPSPWEPYPRNAGVWEMEPLLGISSKQFWEPLNCTTFWENLEWARDGKVILQRVESMFGRDSVALLTAPGGHQPIVAHGKLMWIKEHLPHYMHSTFLGVRKDLLAHPGAILIDDKDANIDDFRDAGGAGVLVPRPWNSGHAVCEAAHLFVSAELETYLDEMEVDA